jgi:hypothetical protein
MSVPFSFIYLRPPIRSVRRLAEYPFSHAGEAEGVAIITFNLILAHVVLAAQKKESNTLCLRRVIKLADIKGGEALIKEINHLAKASKASIPVPMCLALSATHTERTFSDPIFSLITHTRSLFVRSFSFGDFNGRINSLKSARRSLRTGTNEHSDWGKGKMLPTNRIQIAKECIGEKFI